MYCYDKEGKLISWDEYSKLYNQEYSRVALTEFDDGSSVSTVWLGLNHQWDDDKAPLIFETMIFHSEDSEELCWRYSTEAEALAGHERAVLDWMKSRATARIDL